MRKVVTIIFILATMILTSCSSGKSSTLYPETGKVVGIYDEVVAVETSTGNIFEFYGSEDWMTGDCVSLTMDSCGTQKVTDDKVVDAHYSAWKIN